MVHSITLFEKAKDIPFNLHTGKLDKNLLVIAKTLTIEQFAS